MKVLVADDSQPIRDRLVDRLSRIPDIEVVQAIDTLEALQQMVAFKPDVAVLDVRMPGGGGIKALAEIKKNFPHTTVMVMTNYPYAQYRRKCLDEGADFFFDKSTEFERVAETVRQLMQSVNVGDVALRTAAEQLVAAKEESEKKEQCLRDMGILGLLHETDDSHLNRAYGMWVKTFDAMPDLVAIFDEAHTIVRVNKTMADFLGVPAAELTGKKCFEYIHGTTCPVNDCPHEAMLQDGREHTREMYSERADAWFNVSVSPIYEGGHVIGAIHVAHDITVLKQAELYKEIRREVLEVLNEQEELEQSIQRVLDILKKQTGFDAVGIRLKNGEDFPYYVQEGFPTDFLVLENTLVERNANGGVCRNKDGSVCLECTCGLVLSGKTDPANPLFTKGRSCWTNDSFPLLDLPANQDPRLHPRNNCIHHGYASVALIPIRSKNHIVGLIQFNDRRKGRFTLDTIERLEEIAAHIGEAMMRKQADLLIKKSEIRYRRLFESMQTGFALHKIICDEKGIPCDYLFLEVNPAFELLTGLQAKDLIGRTVKEVMPATESRWIETYGKVALTGEPAQLDDFAGSLGRHFSVSAYSPEKGQFATIFSDVTEQKNIETAIRQAQNIAEVANAAKTQFMANMSHELRTPLNAIIGLTELLEDSKLDEEQLDYAKTISASGEVLLNLVNDLLDLSRIELGKIEVKNEAFNIRDVTEKAVALISPLAAKKGLELTCVIEETVPKKITGDSARLQQVLVNLLNNAFKFTDKGFIQLTVCGQITPGGSRRVVFAVRDSGEGIDDATMKRIFQPFQQGDSSNTRAHGGAGLGLAISKNLVEMMGGIIRVESRKGEGSLFIFHITDQAESKNQVSAGDVHSRWQGHRC